MCRVTNQGVRIRPLTLKDRFEKHDFEDADEMVTLDTFLCLNCFQLRAQSYSVAMPD